MWEERKPIVSHTNVRENTHTHTSYSNEWIRIACFMVFRYFVSEIWEEPHRVEEVVGKNCFTNLEHESEQFSNKNSYEDMLFCVLLPRSSSTVPQHQFHFLFNTLYVCTWLTIYDSNRCIFIISAISHCCEHESDECVCVCACRAKIWWPKYFSIQFM